MSKQKQIHITNGDMEAWVSPKSVPVYERRGWTVADDGSSESETAPAEAAVVEETPVEKKTTSRKAD